MEYSAAIPFDCVPDHADWSNGVPPPRSTFEEIIEAMPNIGDVSISRSGPDSVNGYISAGPQSRFTRAR